MTKTSRGRTLQPTKGLLQAGAGRRGGAEKQTQKHPDSRGRKPNHARRMAAEHDEVLKRDKDDQNKAGGIEVPKLPEEDVLHVHPEKILVLQVRNEEQGSQNQARGRAETG